MGTNSATGIIHLKATISGLYFAFTVFQRECQAVSQGDAFGITWQDSTEESVGQKLDRSYYMKLKHLI